MASFTVADSTFASQETSLKQPYVRRDRFSLVCKVLRLSSIKGKVLKIEDMFIRNYPFNKLLFLFCLQYFRLC